MVVSDHLVTSPAIPIRGYRDGFGNWCNRIVAPTGCIRLSAKGSVNDTGEPDRVASLAQQHPVEDLPDEALVFLLGSRYCETYRLSEIAWSLFGKTALGWSRVQAICDYTNTSPLATNTRAPPERRGKPTAIAPASAGTMRTSRSLFAAA
jgi:transglutaminase-like putative cysteine protease